jgi:hypothetical protein
LDGYRFFFVEKRRKSKKSKKSKMLNHTKSAPQPKIGGKYHLTALAGGGECVFPLTALAGGGDYVF